MPARGMNQDYCLMYEAGMCVQPDCKLPHSRARDRDTSLPVCKEFQLGTCSLFFCKFRHVTAEHLKSENDCKEKAQNEVNFNSEERLGKELTFQKTAEEVKRKSSVLEMPGEDSKPAHRSAMRLPKKTDLQKANG